MLEQAFGAWIRIFFFSCYQWIWNPLIKKLTPHQSTGRNHHLILILTGLWILSGIWILLSVSSINAQDILGDANYYVRRQLIGLIFASTLISGRFLFDSPKNLKKWNQIGLLLIWCLLWITLQEGTVIGGAGRWLILGGQLLQPSELIKPFFIVQAAILFSDWTELTLQKRVLWIGVLGSTILAILLQPNLSTALLFSLILWNLAWLSNQINIKMVLSAAGIILFLSIVSVSYNDYQRIRITSFLNPWKYPYDEGYQLIQSLIAIRSGSWWGIGWGFSEQKLYALPICYTDFIFSIYAEEFGFIGCIIGLIFLWFFWKIGLQIYINTKNGYNRLIGLGSLHALILQTIFHIGVCLGLLPTTGLPLPFISYGINAIVANIAMVMLLFHSSQRLGE